MERSEFILLSFFDSMRRREDDVYMWKRSHNMRSSTLYMRQKTDRKKERKKKLYVIIFSNTK